MLFSAKILTFLSFQILGGGGVTGQVPPHWFPRIQQEFSNASFPLRRCFKRGNKAPLHGSVCGPKSKTCFFGDQECGIDEVSPYPAESCTCNGTSSNDLGTWMCQTEACPVQECQDVVLTEQPWFDVDGFNCIEYEENNDCVEFGGNTTFQNFGLVANQSCCTCGGGIMNSTTLVCSDIIVPLNPPLQWTDSVGDNCSWYADSPHTRCVDFANERRFSRFQPEFNLTVGEACCACAGIVPPVNPTCTDLPTWNLNNSTCSDMTREDCLLNPESFGVSVEEACCKCGVRATNPNAPINFDFRTEPSTAGGCNPDNSTFDICMKLAPNIAAEDVAVFSAARERWSSIIVQDSPDFQYDFDIINTTGFQYESAPENVTDLPAFYESLCGFHPGFPLVNSTDDVDICTVQRPLSSPGILAQAGPVYGDSFARFGIITVNADVIRGLRTNGTLDDVVLHELGHILGIGTLWQSDAPGQLLVNSSTCDYLGENANRVYQEISGCSSVNDTLPIQDPFDITLSFFGANITLTFCSPGHLLDECFLDELMTAAVDGATTLPLSTVTIAMLEDLGYTVDYSQADPYTKANMNASCVCDNNDNTASDLLANRMLRGRDAAAPTRQLSDEGRATVHEYAKKELKRMNELAMSYMVNTQDENGKGGAAVGIPGLTVMFMEDGQIFTEHVMNGEDEFMEEVIMAKAEEEGIDLDVEDWKE